jgi:hypothetical protein
MYIYACTGLPWYFSMQPKSIATTLHESIDNAWNSIHWSTAAYLHENIVHFCPVQQCRGIMHTTIYVLASSRPSRKDLSRLNRLGSSVSMADPCN